MQAWKVASGVLGLVALGSVPSLAQAAAATPSPPPETGSIGRYEMVAGSATSPPLLLDTASGTSWVLLRNEASEQYGWAHVGMMDASEAADTLAHARRLRAARPEEARIDVYKPPPPPGLR